MKRNGRQRGFTLIELLVVVGILAALAAILIPNVARFVGRGQQEGAAAEMDSIQAAMDAAMADKGFLTVAASPGGGVEDFSVADTETVVPETGEGADIDPDGAATLYLYPTYLRLEHAKYGPYTWDSSGLVSRP